MLKQNILLRKKYNILKRVRNPVTLLGGACSQAVDYMLLEAELSKTLRNIQAEVD